MHIYVCLETHKHAVRLQSVIGSINFENLYFHHAVVATYNNIATNLTKITDKNIYDLYSKRRCTVTTHNFFLLLLLLSSLSIEHNIAKQM